MLRRFLTDSGRRLNPPGVPGGLPWAKVPAVSSEQEDAIRDVDQVLQAEDIALVESVQRGLRSRGYSQGRFVVDGGRTDMTEHAVHHFHALVVAALNGGQ